MEPQSTKQKIAEFTNTLEEIRREFKKLQQQNESLRAENNTLRSENTKLKATGDLFSGLPEKKRLLLKQQIQTIMDRIDEQMEELQ